ncbi:MAG: ABC transporter ATP-binding protein [Nitrospirae bacterium]|nr:ABC transporter ATP-binding protein [Nitrospirota bacterium]MBI5696878.1 ABC transporter ATP-binding protein [Nitrospirota bacterium]
MALLKTENVSYSYYGRIPALDGVSIEVAEGDRYAIIGSNGSGKSTLLQMLNGLIHPERGRLFFRGDEVTEGALREAGFLRHFRERVGFVFQDSDVQLFSPTVQDELLFGPVQLGLTEEESMSRAADVMKMLGIEGLRDRPSYMLSGGEKKRVAIGSVLTMNPEVLLLDEPTNGLDPKSQCFLIELIFQLNEAGKTIVISTHDLSLVSELDSSVAVLSEDHKVERIGRGEDILKDEDMLLKVNLIHEHMHSHGQTTHRHRHSHFVFHRH